MHGGEHDRKNEPRPSDSANESIMLLFVTFTYLSEHLTDTTVYTYIYIYVGSAHDVLLGL